METWLAGALTISFGIVSGKTRVRFSTIDTAKAVVVRGLAADSGADDGRGAHRQRHVEDKAGLRNRLARGHHGELRDTIERGQLPLGKMLERIEILDLGGDFLASVPHEHGGSVIGPRPLTPAFRLSQ